MVCSACGFDNPAAMRFCGMCGMPLPHRPITAPGAQSTLNFTRVPVELRVAPEGTAASHERIVSPEAASLAMAGERGVFSSSSLTPEPTASTSIPAAVEEAPPKELVPDIPLDEYLQKFHYDPPNDPSEVTMRGDARVEASAVEVSRPPESAVEIADPNLETETKPSPNTASKDGEDVDRRLGLEPEAPGEASISRPRFLDVNELPAEKNNGKPKETRLVDTSAPTISGPSFLGLNDAPQTWAGAVGLEEGKYAPRNYHLRAWFTVAIIFLFAWLGYKEYRAQVNQTDNGPVEVVRTKIRNLRQSVTAQMAGDSTPAANDNSKPEIQVQEQSGAKSPQSSKTGTAEADATAQPQAPPAVSSEAAGAPGAAGQSQANAASEQNPVTNNSLAGQGQNPASNAAAKQPNKAQSKRQAEADAQPDADSHPPVPGAEEMTKAKNASDSAAEAAWLWKATAKGNPDAPVQLADMYIQGDGVPRSCEQAVVLLKTAAAKENARARNRLASLYANGTCVQRNRVEAYRWLSSALTANPNSQWAQQNKDLIWQQMTPDERVMAQKYR